MNRWQVAMMESHKLGSGIPAVETRETSVTKGKPNPEVPSLNSGRAPRKRARGPARKANQPNHNDGKQGKAEGGNTRLQRQIQNRADASVQAAVKLQAETGINFEDARLLAVKKDQAHTTVQEDGLSIRSFDSSSSSESSSAASTSSGSRKKRQKSHKTSSGGTRQKGRANMTTASLLASLQASQGHVDALKESQEGHDGPTLQAAFLEYAMHIKEYFKRNLAMSLYRHWGKGYYSESAALNRLVSSFVSQGLQIHLSASPQIVLGAVSRAFPDAEHYLPSHWVGGGPTPFYDQMIPPEYLEGCGFGAIISNDGDASVYCHLGVPFIAIDRYEWREVPLSFVGRYFPGQVRTRFCFDSHVAALVSHDRVYSEGVFHSDWLRLSTDHKRPNYVEYQPSIINDTLLCVYHDSYELLRSRICYADRRGPLDDRLVDKMTGVDIGPVTVSFQTATEMFGNAKSCCVNALGGLLSGLGRSDDAGPDAGGPPRKDDDDSDDSSDWGATIKAFLPSFGPSDDKGKEPEDPRDRDDDEKGSSGSENRDSSDHESSLFGRFSEICRQTFVGFTGPPGAASPEDLSKGATTLQMGASIVAEQAVESLVDSQTGGFMSVASRVSSHIDEWRDGAAARLGLVTYLFLKRGQAGYLAKYVQSSAYLDIRAKRKTPLISGRLWNDDEFQYHSREVFRPWGFTFTWQESGQVVDGVRISYEEYYRSLPVNNRVEITLLKPLPSCPGAFSEVCYGLFFTKAHCLGQDYLPVALRMRLDRVCPEPTKAGKRMAQRCLENLEYDDFPDVAPTTLITDRLEYAEILEKMPPASRKKHLEYFDQYVAGAGADFAFLANTDSAFVKSDEVLVQAKGRIIINPPAGLFYRLVCHIRSVKAMLKHKMFLNVYDQHGVRITWTYGADMDFRQKSEWYSEARYRSEKGGASLQAHILVGGDDNGVLFGDLHGRVWAWESDVTACDQSHNSMLVETMCSFLASKKMDADALEFLRESYKRTINTGLLSCVFKKTQLHTGHPQTSTCNTLVVFLVATAIIINMGLDMLRFIINGHTERLEEALTGSASHMGMIWKNQIHLDAGNLTFHKGCWLPSSSGPYDYVWVPLPSCLWKSFKMRSNVRVPHTDLYLRMMYTLYQRLISPNFSFVQIACKKQFDWYMHTHMPWLGSKYGNVSSEMAFAMFLKEEGKLSLKLRRWIGTQYNKAGEVDLETMAVESRLYNWPQQAEIDFCLARYRISPESLSDFLIRWDGSPGYLHSPFVLSTIRRDYRDNHNEYQSYEESPTSYAPVTCSDGAHGV